MSSNYLTNFEMDPIIPDLLPEGSFLNDLLDNNIPLPVIPNTDIVTLNQRIDQLSLDTNTQSLRIEVEKAKRQKLGATVRRLRQDVLPPHHEIVRLRQDLDIMRNEQNSINYYFEAEIASNRTLAFRGLSRIHQILALMSPPTILPVNHGPELNQLIQELGRTLQQFPVEYTASYV